MKGYTKSQIMKAAWKLAKIGAKKFGGSAKMYLSESLKIIWGQVKSAVLVPSWFYAKKFFVRPCENYLRGFVQKETEKAVYVKCDGDYFRYPNIDYSDWKEGTAEVKAVANTTMYVRNAASTSGAILGTVRQGAEVTVLEQLSNGWLKIAWNDGYGYTSNVKGVYYRFV